MFTVGKTRYTKVVHNKYTLCAWQNKLATKTLYRNSAGHVQREKLLFKASSQTVLFLVNSSHLFTEWEQHDSTPQATYEHWKELKRGQWTFQLELCSSGEKKKKSLTSFTRAPSVRMTAFDICRGSLKAAPFLRLIIRQQMPPFWPLELNR